jgi:DNA replication protein DnaC
MNTKTSSNEVQYPDLHGDFSIDEIISRNLPYKHLPEAKPCKFCGKLIEPIGMVFFGIVSNWKEPPCDCERAKAETLEQQRKALQQRRLSWAERQKEIDKANAEALRTQFTLTELRERNYPLDTSTVPEPFVCEFCGKVTEPEAMICLSLLFWKPLHCDCEPGLEKRRAEEAEWERQAAEEEARKKQAELDERVRRILGDSGIKTRFMSRTFENFTRDTPQRNEAYINARGYADNYADRFAKDGTGLYLEGTFGTGKTHLAVAIALHLIRQGVGVICKTSIDLLMDIKAAFRYEGGEEEETAKYKRCPLLVIDDLGKEQCTEWSLPKLYEIINDRYEKCKPTVVTTNYSHDDLVRRLVPRGGDNVTAGALVSRLKESAIIMPMVWNDWREGGK